MSHIYRQYWDLQMEQPEVKQPKAKQIKRCPKGTHRNKKLASA